MFFSNKKLLLRQTTDCILMDMIINHEYIFKPSLILYGMETTVLKNRNTNIARKKATLARKKKNIAVTQSNSYR